MCINTHRLLKTLPQSGTGSRCRKRPAVLFSYELLIGLNVFLDGKWLQSLKIFFFCKVIKFAVIFARLFQPFLTSF